MVKVGGIIGTKKKPIDMVKKAQAEFSGEGEAASRLMKEAGSRDKMMKPTHLKGSAPVFAKKGGAAKKKGGKCK